ncbi:hypothetical protein [Parasulfitobacter algicola]|uniref:Uncharacterized protein n=1 Tax=Parasulfitobacter algicola TaxID=2614809 RepID=A0ABX2IRV4_9RHOB|nr:hypothetical protein [Sulfitobacter algicola]NSX54746.1 hypothetical protein [Sulfitobacter algicola]
MVQSMARKIIDDQTDPNAKIVLEWLDARHDLLKGMTLSSIVVLLLNSGPNDRVIKAAAELARVGKLRPLIETWYNKIDKPIHTVTKRISLSKPSLALSAEVTNLAYKTQLETSSEIISIFRNKNIKPSVKTGISYSNSYDKSKKYNAYGSFGTQITTQSLQFNFALKGNHEWSEGNTKLTGNVAADARYIMADIGAFTSIRFDSSSGFAVFPMGLKFKNGEYRAGVGYDSASDYGYMSIGVQDVKFVQNKFSFSLIANAPLGGRLEDHKYFTFGLKYILGEK